MARRGKPRTPPDLVEGGTPKKGRCDYCNRGPYVTMIIVGDDGEAERAQRPVLVAGTTQKTRVCVACFRELHEDYYAYHMNHGILSMEAIR